MVRIRLDTDHIRGVGRQLASESHHTGQIGGELQSAMNSLDTWVWDGRSRAAIEPLLDQVRPSNARVAEELDRLSRLLFRVAEQFEDEDNKAARDLEGMPWVDWDTGGQGTGAVGGIVGGVVVGGVTGGAVGAVAGGSGGNTGQGSVWTFGPSEAWESSDSYNFGNQRWENEKEIEVKLKLVEDAYYKDTIYIDDYTTEERLGAYEGGFKVGLKDDGFTTGTYGEMELAGVSVEHYSEEGGVSVEASVFKFEGGSKAGIGEDGLTVGAYGEFTSAEISADGVVGSSDLGVTGGVQASGPQADGFIGLKDNTLGASVGVSLVSAEAEAGLNIAGANVGVKGGVSLGLEFGFKIGQETEVKFGPFSLGLTFGKAKGSQGG
ncbi:MAG: WXG100 family type VII secretion target [Anaerolineae bacterium]|nr:WXG100 family type VII secretion target [Anaerolineae bacterium]